MADIFLPGSFDFQIEKGARWEGVDWATNFCLSELGEIWPCLVVRKSNFGGQSGTSATDF